MIDLRKTTAILPAFLQRTEPLIFLLIVCINLAPALEPRYFPSMDGPAHLYNSLILGDLLSDSNSFYAQYIAFNPIPVPNAAAHYLLTFLNAVFGAALAHKLLIVFILSGLPYAFRYCVSKFGGGRAAAYLAFPFTYSFTFCLGFYGFHLGCIFLLFALPALAAFFNQQRTWRNLLSVAVFALICYFSHILVFGVLLFVAFLLFARDFSKSGITVQSVRRGVLLAAIFSPALILSVIYFAHVPYDGVKTYLPKSQLFEELISFQSIICYRLDPERKYAMTLFGMFLLLFVTAVIAGIISLRKNGRTKPATGTLFLAGSLFLLLLYFLLPDGTSNGSIISVRLSYLSMLFLALWVGCARLDRKIMLPALLVLFFCQYKLVRDHRQAFRDESSQQWQYEKVAAMIPEFSTLDYISGDTWIGRHNSNLIGLNKRILVLENYELTTPYFPLMWKKGHRFAGLINQEDKVSVLARNPRLRPDFLLFKRKPDQQAVSLDQRLQPFYSAYFHTADLWLFKLRVSPKTPAEL